MVKLIIEKATSDTFPPGCMDHAPSHMFPIRLISKAERSVLHLAGDNSKYSEDTPYGDNNR